MVSKGQKRRGMYTKPRPLSSITKSHECHKCSVVLDACQYLPGMKRKLEKLDEAVLANATAHNSSDHVPMPMLKVEKEEEGFVIRVLSERSCEGLLLFILEAFEEMGLDVVEARATCVDTFCLEAIAAKEDDEEIMDVQVVEQIVFQAIQNWRELSKQL